MSVICGNRNRHTDGTPVPHATVEAVRACYQAPETWTCGWQSSHIHPEDGETYAVECEGLSWHLPDGRGYTCEHGHDHIHAEVRAAEGWDYAADPGEAGLLAGRGIQPVSMAGGAIEIDPDALRYAMTL